MLCFASVVVCALFSSVRSTCVCGVFRVICSREPSCVRARSANFLDADHGPVVDEEYCEEVPNAAQTDAVCNLLARDPTLRSGQVRLPPRPGKPQPFWQWHLSDAVRGGFCAKYGAREARCAGAAQRCEAAAEGDGMISAFRSAFAAQQTAAST